MSPVFDKMFNGDWKESSDDKIELKDTNFDEFVELLNVIYPSDADVTCIF